MISPTHALWIRRSMAGRLYSAFLLGLLPVVAPAQFTFTTNNGALTITGYAGSATTLVIPACASPITSV